MIYNKYTIIKYLTILIWISCRCSAFVGHDEGSSKHKTDSLTILLFLFLLLIIVLTIWLFKHRRFRFVHETGLAIIIGLIIGAIIRYTREPTRPPVLQLPSYYAENAPLSVFINLQSNITNKTKQIQYDYFGEVQQPEDKENMERIVSFNYEVFWNIFLPLIIFNAGYSMKRKHFFRNIGAIMVYAFIGTAISCFVVGGVMFGITRIIPYLAPQFTLTECFIFGALISATDPVTVLAIFSDLHVDVDLYALIFGESVLNDAVAIVLTRSISRYGETSISNDFNAGAFFQSLGSFFGIMMGAFAIGAVMGCITAILTKFTKIKEHPVLETSLFCLLSFITFEAAEAAELSGIVSVLFCGITQAHYTYNNLSAESQARTKQLFEVLNFLSENFIFLYIGVSIFTFQPQEWSAWFILGAVFAILLGRFLNIYPLSFILNLFRNNKITFKFQNMMMFSGLRGAIAFALSSQNTNHESRQYMLTTTMIIVLISVVLCGGFTTPMLQWLQIRVGMEDVTEAITSGQVSSQLSLPASSPVTSSSSSSKAWLVAKWYNFDRYFMKPLLTNCRPTLMDTLPNCCLPLARFLTTSEQMADARVTRDQDSDTDIIIDNSEMSFGESSHGDTPTPNVIQSEHGQVYIEDHQLEINCMLPSDPGDDVPLLSP